MNLSSGLAEDVLFFAPVHMLDALRGRRLVVRSDDPRSFPGYLKGGGLERVEYLQLTDLEADPSSLLKWKAVFPLDLVMTVPGRQFPRLYTYAPLLDRGPVRVSIPAADGLEKAVKLAASLRFSVKIIPGQPGVDEVMHLIRLADFYLRNPTIEEPIEFFHSLFFAAVNGVAATLWDILEENPARYRWVSDEGRLAEGLPGPLPDAAMGAETAAETKIDSQSRGDLHRQEGVNRNNGCPDCTCFRWCRGFFKHPVSDYSCGAVLPLFQHLFTAAAEFRQDLAVASLGTSP